MPVIQGRPPKSDFAAFKLERHVDDLDKSLWFWCDLVGFDVAYELKAE